MDLIMFVGPELRRSVREVVEMQRLEARRLGGRLSKWYLFVEGIG